MLRILPRKQPCLLGSIVAQARVCEESWAVPEWERQGLQVRVSPRASAHLHRREEGCLSCREVIGTDGLWQNKREMPIRGSRAPQ